MPTYHDPESHEISREEFLATGCPGCVEKDKRIAELESRIAAHDASGCSVSLLGNEPVADGLRRQIAEMEHDLRRLAGDDNLSASSAAVVAMARLEAHCRESDEANAQSMSVVLSLEGTVERLKRESDDVRASAIALGWDDSCSLSPLTWLVQRAKRVSDLTDDLIDICAELHIPHDHEDVPGVVAEKMRRIAELESLNLDDVGVVEVEVPRKKIGEAVIHPE